MTKPLQYGFAERCGDAAYNRIQREKKAAKVITILENAVGQLGSHSLLDIGCSTGFMTHYYARHFGRVVGTDIDLPALHHASELGEQPNLSWSLMDSQQLAFSDQSFDVVTCTHIYEHVPDADCLMSEIYRVLKPSGVCLFSAGNRLSLMEPHYRLPLLSVIPKPMAHVYLKLFRRGDFYYENHLSYWGLKRLVSAFLVDDYTLKVIEAPEKYHAEDVLIPGSRKQWIALAMLRTMYWLCPTYLWILRKIN